MTPSFLSELTHLINKHSKESGSNTPDFILAEYLCLCLESFDHAVTARAKWMGYNPTLLEYIPNAQKDI